MIFVCRSPPPRAGLAGPLGKRIQHCLYRPRLEHVYSTPAASRRASAAGSGTSVQDVNRLLKQHKQMQDMMKRMKKAGGIQNLFGRGGLPPGMLPR